MLAVEELDGTSAELEEVAKKKKASTPVSSQSSDMPAKTLFSVKGDAIWYEWLKEYAVSRAMNITTLVDFALNEQAKRDGFHKPMPKRFGR